MTEYTFTLDGINTEAIHETDVTAALKAIMNLKELTYLNTIALEYRRLTDATEITTFGWVRLIDNIVSYSAVSYESILDEPADEAEDEVWIPDDEDDEVSGYYDDPNELGHYSNESIVYTRPRNHAAGCCCIECDD